MKENKKWKQSIHSIFETGIDKMEEKYLWGWSIKRKIYRNNDEKLPDNDVKVTLNT